MPLKLDYESGLAMLHDLLKSEYEGRTGFEKNGDKSADLKKAKPAEADLNLPDDKEEMVSRERRLKGIMAVLQVCKHDKRVRALAWVKREMLINARILVEDSPTYLKIMEKFRITEKEVNREMVNI